MLEILFGPDGVGKSTLAGQMQASDNPPLVLHGTNLQRWFGNHAELLAAEGFTESDIPPDDDFEAKIRLLNVAALALAASHEHVVVDGHSLHKTAINVAAGHVQILGAPRGTDIDTLLDGPLAGYFGQLTTAPVPVRHTYVALSDGLNDDQAARELQRRLANRGPLTKWDPDTVAASRAQVVASNQLESALQQRGTQVIRVASSLP